MHFFTQSLSQKQEKQVCSQHITELEFANGRSEHVLSDEHCTNWLSTNRPSFAAANQVMALMHGGTMNVLKNSVDLLQVSSVQVL